MVQCVLVYTPKHALTNQGWTLGFLLYCALCLFYAIEPGSLPKPGARLIASKPQFTTALGVYARIIKGTFYMGAVCSNSGPCVYITSTLIYRALNPELF